MTATPGQTAEQLVAMLRRHHLPEGRPPAGLFAVEIQAPLSSRRADALWMPLTETGGGLQGFEVKVSRADVLNELADPHKADAWAKYCSKWWLVVPDAELLLGLDVPEHWGVLTPPSGRRTRSMTVVKPAPVNRPYDGGPAFRRLLAWYFHRTDAPLAAAAARERRLHETVEALNVRVRELSAVSGQLAPAQQRVARILARIEESNANEWIFGADADALDDAIVGAAVNVARVHAATEQQLHHLDMVIRHLEAAVAPLPDRAELVKKIRDGAAPSTARIRRTR